MPERVTALILTLGICSCSAEIPVDPGTTETMSVVRQIDHILIESSEAGELFSLLSNTFQLPVAWPMSDYGSFSSGGIAAGNVNLEILQTAESDTRGARFVGFALEPEPLQNSLPGLRARGIPYGTPAPFTERGSNGSRITLWTTVALPSVSTDTVSVFLCQYEHDISARRSELLAQLRSRSGGPLSVLLVKEIVYGAIDAPEMQTRWQSLLNPARPSSSGVWPLGAGPAIRVVRAAENVIRGLVIEVESLSRARQFLAERDLLGTDRPGELALAGPGLEGLNITLVEQ